jgi:hypothetical protein
LTNIQGGASAFAVNVTLPPWDQDSCTSCQHGQIQVTQGTTQWDGTEVRGSGMSQCTFTATRQGSFDMHLDVTCSGLTAAGDTRTLDVSGSLSLQGCDGPTTGG